MTAVTLLGGTCALTEKINMAGHVDKESSSGTTNEDKHIVMLIR